MFRALSAITIAAAAGYVAARQLLADETPGRLESLPEGVRGPLTEARERLLRARERARIALQEGRQEHQAAEAALMAQYHAQAGRPPEGTGRP